MPSKKKKTEIQDIVPFSPDTHPPQALWDIKNGTFWFEVRPPPSYKKLGHNLTLFGRSKGLLLSQQWQDQRERFESLVFYQYQAKAQNQQNKLGLSLAKLSNLFFKFGVGLVFAVKDRLSLRYGSVRTLLLKHNPNRI